MMASLAVLGGRGSSLWTWSGLSINASITPAHPRNLPLLLQSSHARVRLRCSCARLLLTSAFSSSPSLPLSSIVQASQLEGRVSAEDVVSTSPRTRPGYRKFPVLSPKEKKDLRAYAHSLGKKIVSQQVGKAGVTEALAKAISDALEAKEILKLKVLDNCPDELEDVIAKIEEATQGQVVGKIGSVITLYRPSLRKLSETERLQNKVEQGGRPGKAIGRRTRA